jgi:transglutaminase-like putative cysteine protease
MKLKSGATALLIITCFVFATGLYAGDLKYPLAGIPKQLLKDAKAVVRNENITVYVKNDGKLEMKVIYAITILNKNGESNATLIQPYNKSIRVSGIKAKLYNESGVEFKKRGGFDVLDYAMISQGTTYADYRLKAMVPEQYKYPYTVEYTYDVSFSDVIQFPGWYPVKDFNVAVQKSSYILNISKQASCRYFEQNITSKVQIAETSAGTVYTWLITDMAALADEIYCPALTDITPVVRIAPSAVNVEGYSGNLDSWTGFGKWINKLNQDRNNLDNETKDKIRKMTEGITDDREKLKKLYEYMQNKTRYVSIQVGIGSFQPFPAETVDRLSYGDCKALSNYMKSLLEVAGISSRYTLVQAGDENPTIHDAFPSNQFNHAILCVPLTNDTVWLECTSQNNPFNYMGTFTADRQVLVIDDNGGKLVHTPGLKPESNLESRKVTVTLDQYGDGAVEAKNIFRGATYDLYMPILMSDQADRKKMVTQRIHVPNFELDNFTIQETKVEKPFVTEQLNFSITSYCPIVGEKLMLCLNMMNKLSDSPFQSTTRKFPVSFKWPVYEVDTVIYIMPQGYTLEKIPAQVNFKSDIGQYTTEVIKNGNTLQYVRTFQVYKAEHPVEKYDEIVSFFEKVATADENKVILAKVK